MRIRVQIQGFDDKKIFNLKNQMYAHESEYGYLFLVLHEVPVPILPYVQATGNASSPQKSQPALQNISRRRKKCAFFTVNSVRKPLTELMYNGMLFTSQQIHESISF
jgi:hypothetical protein